MILQSLHALYKRLKDDPAYEIAPPGYSLQKITFRVVLKPDGTLFEIQDVRVGEKKSARQIRVLGSAKPSGSGLNPCFLWDNTAYMLGFKPDDDNADRSRASFEAFRKRHLEAEATISAPAYSTVCRFLEQWTPEKAAEQEMLANVATGFGVFQLVGETAFVHQDAVVDAWWKTQIESGDKRGPEGQCLLTGEWGKIARLQPMIKGVFGGKAQASLVGFNDPAYESYGKEQSFNAPVGAQAGFEYATALNALLDGPMKSRHRTKLGDMTIAFWTDKPSIIEDVFARFAEYGSQMISSDIVQDESLRQKIEMFLDALRQGIEKYGDIERDADRAGFYILGLSPNAARLSVRLFLRASIRELLDNLRKHYRDMKLERQFDDEPEFPAAWMLLRQTARDSDGIPPILAGPLMRAILTGARYPDGLYSAVIRRVHADRDVNYLRASVIKGYLVRNQRKEISMCLDEDGSDPAYRLGQLFAVLENIQEAAYHEQTGRYLEKGIRDTYFGAACSTPASVFPRLEKLSSHHRRQLHGALKHYFDQMIADIKWEQKKAPAVLSLTDQGEFILGYYHQWKKLRTKKKDQEQPNVNNQEEN